MRGKLRIMDRTGHSTVEWSTDLQDTVDEANRRFNELLGQGYTAFSMYDATTGEQVKEFDANQESIVLIPRMVGG